MMSSQMHFLTRVTQVLSDKTSLKADSEVLGWERGRDQPHRWVKRRGINGTGGSGGAGRNPSVEKAEFYN